MTLDDNNAWTDYIPNGWADLYRQAIADLHALDPDISVSQAKQKFGELRIYLDRHPTGALAITDAATAQSRTRCEACGEPARLMRDAGGYIATLCAAHGDGFVAVAAPPNVRVRLWSRGSNDLPAWNGDDRGEDDSDAR